ncbi:MAG TPA: DUF2759 family protein [Bacillota bacterium]|nr:DUF2759 family protein [Bacillota bacterium]
MVLALILLLVAILSVVSFFRQIKYRNLLAIGFSAVSALVFGFFSLSTIFCHFATSTAFCS